MSVNRHSGSSRRISSLLLHEGDAFVSPYYDDSLDDETVPEEARRKYLQVYPDVALYRRLGEDHAAALQVVQHEVASPSKSRSVRERVQVVGQFCAILKFLLDEEPQRKVLLTDDFSEALWRLVLDPRRWHLIHDHCDASWVDCIGVIMLYLAIRLLILHIDAVREVRHAVKADTHFNRTDCNSKVLLRRFRSFWTIVWEGRESIFDYYLYTETLLRDDTASQTSLRSVVTDCLLEIATLVDGTVSPMFTQGAVDTRAMDAYLAAWLCSGPENIVQSERILHKLYEDMERLAARPKDFEDWFYSAAERDDLLGMDVLDSLRRNLVSRHTTSQMLIALLRMLSLLASHPHIQAEAQTLMDDSDSPPRWIIKALQRQLCVRAGDSNEREVVVAAFEAFLQCCEIWELDVFVMVQDTFGLPFLPYLGRFATICAIEPTTASFKTYKGIILRVLRTLEDIGVPLLWLPFFGCASTRRAWITTLQELHSCPPSTVSKAVIELWLALGHAHRFNEQSELAWLHAHHGALPRKLDGPAWSHCAWSGCMCFEQKPLYQLSACKGCWRAYYCGKRCQQSDWKNGHREHCLHVQGDLKVIPAQRYLAQVT